jgi:putative membrane protein
MMLGIFAVFSQVDQFFPQANVYELLGKSVMGLTGSGIVVIIGLLAVILLVSWVLSIIGSAIRLWNYTISRNDDIISISRGLLERNQYMLPVKRIQAIAISESALRQPFGLVSIEAVTAGGREKGSMTSQVFPLMRRDEVDSFLGRFLPEFAVEARVERVSPAALISYLAPVTGIIMAIALAATILVPYGYCAFLLLVPAVFWAYMRYRDAGWRLQGDIMIIRQRLLGRTTYLIAGGKIQSMTASRTFLQARRRLATVSAAVPSAYGGMTAAVAGVSEDRCELITDWFRARRAPGR